MKFCRDVPLVEYPQQLVYLPQRGNSMETYRIHENERSIAAGKALTPGSNKAPQEKEQPAFDRRVHRLRSLANAASLQSARLDSSVMRLSGLSPPRTGSDCSKEAEPVSILAQFDTVLDWLEETLTANDQHLNRLESL